MKIQNPVRPLVGLAASFPEVAFTNTAYQQFERVLDELVEAENEYVNGNRKKFLTEMIDVMHSTANLLYKHEGDDPNNTYISRPFLSEFSNDFRKLSLGDMLSATIRIEESLESEYFVPATMDLLNTTMQVLYAHNYTTFEINEAVNGVQKKNNQRNYYDAAHMREEAA